MQLFLILFFTEFQWWLECLVYAKNKTLLIWWSFEYQIFYEAGSVHVKAQLAMEFQRVLQTESPCLHV